MEQKKIIVILALIVGIGLTLGPAATMITQEEKQENKEKPQEKPKGPEYITTTQEYTAQAKGSVVEISPMIVATGTSNSGDKEEIKEKVMEIEGVENVSVERKKNEGETGLYKLTVQVITKNQSYNERVNYYLQKKLGEKINFQTKVSRAKVTPPEEVNATRKQTGEKKKIEVGKRNISGIVYPYSQPGETTQFRYIISMTGGQMRNIQALQGRKLYSPPKEEWKAEKNLTVLEITGKEVLVGFGNKSNVSELQETLDSQGYNASIKQLPTKEFGTKISVVYGKNASEPEFKEGNITAHYLRGKVELPAELEASRENKTKKFNLTGFNETNFRTEKEVEEGETVKVLVTLETTFEDLTRAYAEII